MTWIFWSILTTILWAIQSVSTYYFTNKQKYNATAVNTFSHLFGTILIIIFIIVNKDRKKILSDLHKIYTKVPFIMLCSSIFMMFGNILLYMAYSIIPSNINAGLATGISELSIILSTFLAYMFLKSKISATQGGGILICFFSLWVATVGTTIVKKTKKERKKAVGEDSDTSKDDIKQQEKPIEYNYKWFTYSILSALFYSLGMFTTNLLTKKIKNINTVSISFLVPFIQLVIGVLLFLLLQSKDISKELEKAEYGLDNYVRDTKNLFSEKKNILNGLINGIGEAGGMIGLVKAYSTAANGGIVDAITGGYAVLQAPLLKLIFDVPLDKNVLFGLVGQVIGSILLLK
jgi:drug/metabolite transporter (DMT)-like permease